MKNIKLRYYLRGLGIGMLVTACIMIVTGDKEAKLTDAQIREQATALGMVDGNSLVLSDLRTEGEPDEPTAGEEQPDAEDTQGTESIEDSGAQSDAEPDTEGAQNPGAEPDTEGAQNPGAEPDTEGSQNPGAEPDSKGAQNPGAEPDTEGAQNPGAGPDTEGAQNPGAEPDTESAQNPGAEQDTETKKDKQEAIVKEDTVTLIIYAGANSYTVSKKLEEVGLVADAKKFDDYLCDMGYSKTVRVGVYEIAKGTSEEEIARIIAGKR